MNTSLKWILTFLSMILISCNQGVFTDPELYEEELAESQTNCNDNTESGFDSGDGTPLSPYTICKKSQLDFLRVQMIINYANYFDKSFKLTANINLEGDELEVFLPIGDITDVTLTTESAPPNAKPFQGTFDGNGHIIYNYYVEGENFSYVGLFQYLGDRAIVKNLDLRYYFNLSGVNAFVGGVAGYSEGLIENVTTRGVISGDRVGISGMVAGYQKNGELKDLNIGGQITTIFGVKVGGIAGVVNGATLGNFNFFNNISHQGITIPSKVEGFGDVGGLFGIAENGILIQGISPSFNVKCSGGDICGGLVGTMKDSTITNIRYLIASVESNASYVGGLVGNLETGTISNINPTGNPLAPVIPLVKGVYGVGGIAGYAGNLTLSQTEIYTDVECAQGSCGSIAGEIDSSNITSTDVTCNVKGEDPLFVDEYNMGGAFGQSTNISISTSNINVNVRGNHNIGGVIGLGLESSSVTSTTFNGDVEGFDYPSRTSENIGGVIGRTNGLTSIDDVTVNDLVNNNMSGAISIGGVVGLADLQNDDEVFIKDTDVKFTTIIGSLHVGGMIGHMIHKLRVEGSNVQADVYGDGNVGGVIGKGYASGGFLELENLTITDSALGIKGDSNVGGICGICEFASTFTDINLLNMRVERRTASVSQNNVGGAVGSLIFGTLDNVNISNSTILNLNASNLGGLVGSLSNSTIKNSSIQEMNMGTYEVAGKAVIGGLVGYATNSNIIKSFSTVDIVSSGSYTGGLVGRLNNSLIEDSFQRGRFFSTGDYIGGLIGLIENTSIARRLYFGEGSIVGGITKGGAIAVDTTADNTISDVVWDSMTSTVGVSAGGSGHTTTEMNSTTPYTNFDFQNVWQYTPGTYPSLR